MTGDPVVLESASRLSWAAVTSDGKMIVTRSGGGTVQRYCASSGDAIGESMGGHQIYVRCVAFSSNDEMIGTGSEDSSIIRWSTATGKRIGEPLIHNERVLCLSISDDGTTIASLTTDGVLRRWDAMSGQLICECFTEEEYGRIIWTNNDGTKIVIWSRPCHRITCWSVEPVGAILKTFSLPLPGSVSRCSIDMNLAVVVVGCRDGAVGIFGIHELFDWMFTV